MGKKIVKFQRGWGRYNKGEVAGFEADQAEKLCTGDKAVATMIGNAKPGKKTAPSAKVLNNREAELSARETELDERAEELDAREAALIEREKALDPTPPKAPAKAEAGAPPKTS